MKTPLRHRAEDRVAACVEQLERGGVHAEGRVGDADPLQAIADALATFPADEVVITAQAESSIRLADELVLRARDRFTLPTFRVGITSTEAHEARDSRGDRRHRLRSSSLST